LSRGHVFTKSGAGSARRLYPFFAGGISVRAKGEMHMIFSCQEHNTNYSIRQSSAEYDYSSIPEGIVLVELKESEYRSHISKNSPIPGGKVSIEIW